VLQHFGDPPDKIITKLSTHRCCGDSLMATGNDHDPSAEDTSLRCDLIKVSRPKHNSNRAVVHDRS